jgi:hypothetical protein
MRLPVPANLRRRENTKNFEVGTVSKHFIGSPVPPGWWRQAALHIRSGQLTDEGVLSAIAGSDEYFGEL